ncbi:MAG: ArsI/CadI family heavy metal resistance metalloenzyme [Bacteroidota bacterium]
MKRFHVHLRVNDLHESIRFYQALFRAEPTVVKGDYAKWMLDDPQLNFAISSGEGIAGIRHLGLQTDSSDELKEVYQNLQNADGAILEEGDTTCCYAKSEKSWITDPQGVEWEAFYTYGDATVYGEGIHARPSPENMKHWQGNENVTEKKACNTLMELPVSKTKCC